MSNCVISGTSGKALLVGTPGLLDTRLSKTILGRGALQWGDKLVADADREAFLKDNKQFPDVWTESPELGGPLRLLPETSPHYKGGDYGTTPGATLDAWDGWRVVP